jgi:hypothetical protein
MSKFWIRFRAALCNVANKLPKISNNASLSWIFFVPCTCILVAILSIIRVMPAYVYTQIISNHFSIRFAPITPYSIIKLASQQRSFHLEFRAQARQASPVWFDWFGVHTLSHFPFQVGHFLDSGDPLEVIWGEDTPFYYALHLRRIDPCLAKRNHDQPGEIRKGLLRMLTKPIRATSQGWGAQLESWIGVCPAPMIKTITFAIVPHALLLQSRKRAKWHA